ncbi:hypothetical protein Tco_0552528, partial [Tanacetum coccineum]
MLLYYDLTPKLLVPLRIEFEGVKLKQKKQAVTGEGSSAAHNKYYDSSDTNSDVTLYSSSSDKTEESTNESDDADESDMDLSDDNPDGDDDA